MARQTWGESDLLTCRSRIPSQRSTCLGLLFKQASVRDPRIGKLPPGKALDDGPPQRTDESSDLRDALSSSSPRSVGVSQLSMRSINESGTGQSGVIAPLTANAATWRYPSLANPLSSISSIKA